MHSVEWLGQLHFSKEIFFFSLSFQNSSVAKVFVLVIPCTNDISSVVVQLVRFPQTQALGCSRHDHWAWWRPQTRSSAVHPARLLHSISLASSGPVDPTVLPTSFATCRTRFLAKSGHKRTLLPLRVQSFPQREANFMISAHTGGLQCRSIICKVIKC